MHGHWETMSSTSLVYGGYGGGIVGTKGAVYIEGYGGAGGSQTEGGIASNAGLSATSGEFGKRW